MDAEKKQATVTFEQALRRSPNLIHGEDVDRKLEEIMDRAQREVLEVDADDIEEQTQHTYYVERITPTGAYLAFDPPDDDTSREERTEVEITSYVPFSKDEEGYNRLRFEDAQTLQSLHKKITLEKDEQGREYFKLVDTEMNITSKAYLEKEAKPFAELNWGPKERYQEERQQEEIDHREKEDLELEL